MRIKHHLLLIFLLLCGCCSGSCPVRPVEVKVPVALPCVIDRISEPEWNIPRLAANARTQDRLKAALADLELGRGYIGELEAELAACA